MSDFITSIVRRVALARVRDIQHRCETPKETQLRVLEEIVAKFSKTKVGAEYGCDSSLSGESLYAMLRDAIPTQEYENIRPYVMRMLSGEKDVLWPGKCMRFAQSSGTSGGKSKYVPITSDALRRNHYRGASDSLAFYLHMNPESRMFSGKALTLGGSFANTVDVDLPHGVKVGDLSATLMDSTPFPASLFRVPKKDIALMPDWQSKLPVLAENAAHQHITSISGVPSWMLVVLREILDITGKKNIHEVWPDLEVFLHGGISFTPYREEYRKITDPQRMHYLENYNASEGFFAVQDRSDTSAMLLLLDAGVFYEFAPLKDPYNVLPLWKTKVGEIYEMIVTGMNGLIRYRIGDTVRIESDNPYRITIVGRTKTFINAFGEELMEDNAERGIAAACQTTGASIRNYTAGPYYASDGKRGHHQWAVEWDNPPKDVTEFAAILDRELQRLNSDYEAKRAHGIFLDPLEVISVPEGTFEKWLLTIGNKKLGGQRKVPRLSNDRNLLDAIL